MNAQTLLLAAGYVHRSHPTILLTLARSSPYLNGVSNALAGSSERSRFLGMAIGTAISRLVDEKDNRMDFGLEEIDSAEGKWYQELTQTQDSIGKIDGLKQDTVTRVPRKKPEHLPKPPPSSIPKVVAIDDQSLDGLIPYEKPDSDEEDEDEDPTLIQRNKPTAPV